MFRASVILLAVTAGVLADEEPCLRFFERGILKKCCKKGFPNLQLTEETKEMLRECLSLPRGPNSCDQEMCIATKKGFITPEGKFDMAKIKEKVAMDSDKNPDLAASITKYCLDGDISVFGTPDECDAMKLRRCMEAQVVKVCSEWSNEGQCEGLQDLSGECKKKYN